ncbi:MAG: ABC transporter ATP-binding protein [Bacteriovoracia bacterium]
MKSLWKLKKYVVPYRWLVFGSVLLAIPLSVLRFAPAPIMKYIGDDFFIQRNPKVVYLFPLAFIVIYLLNFPIRFFHYYFLRVVMTRVNQAIKNDLWTHLLGLSADHFTKQSTGTLMSRVASDPQVIDSGILCINVIVREPLTFAFLFGYAFYLNWKLTLVTLIMFPCLAWIFSATARNLKRYIRALSEENANLYSTIQENITGIRVVKFYGLEKYARKKFRERAERFAHILRKTAVLEEAAHPAVELVTAFAIAAVIYYGGLQVLNESMTPGQLLSFFTALALMTDPLRKLNDLNMKLNQAAAATDRVFEVMTWQNHVREAKDPKRVDGFRDVISFERVSFAYPDLPGRNVLTDISFTMKKGETTALVGHSGSGKSSLAALLPRLFDVTHGHIRVDGVDIRDYALADLRKLFSIVSQDVFLFNDTIEENIRCGRFDATREEIRAAAKEAFALDFIEALPDSFKTVIGDRGQKLSGGERQRIAIARAFLRQSPILILDEATSSLDSASEKAVQKALDKLMTNRTTLIIAHRLSTVRNADQIHVIKDGSIIESGDHHDLLDKKGEYAKFIQISDDLS